MALFHRYETLTNTRGDSLVGYRVIARATGAGAQLPIYGDLSGTPIVAISGIANTAISDNDGLFSYFVEEGTVFDEEYYSPSGVFYKRLSGITPGGGAEGPPGPAANSYSSYAALQASDPTQKSAFLVGDTDSSPRPDGAYTNPTGTAGGWVPTPSSGTTFVQPAGSVVRSTQSKLADQVSAKDFGAIGDGAIHKLSEKFSTLAAAQVVYPFATSLDQTFDWAGTQAAINFVEPTGGCVVLPGGTAGNRYVNSNALLIPNYVTLQGSGLFGSIIDNQTYATAEGYQLANKNADVCNYITVRNLRFHGSATTNVGLRVSVSSSCEGWTFDNVRFELHGTTSVSVNKLLQVCRFNNCVFADGQYGFSVSAFTTNAVSFFNCSWERIKRSCLYMRSVEGVQVIGGRMEAGGGAGYATIDVTDAGAFTLIGVYFENTSQQIINDQNSRSGVSFVGCHFTGWSGDTPGLKPYTATTDGVLTFRDCEAVLGVVVSGIVHASGTVGQKIGGPATKFLAERGRGTTRMISADQQIAATVPLMKVTRAGASGANSNLQSLFGEVTVTGILLDSGGFERVFARTIPISIYAIGFNNIFFKAGTPNTTAETNTGSGIDVSVVTTGTTSGTSLTLALQFSGMNPATALGNALRYSFRELDSSALEIDTFQVAIA